MTAAKPYGKGAHVIHDYESFPNGGVVLVRRICKPYPLYPASTLVFEPEGTPEGWGRKCKKCFPVKP